MEGPTLRQPVPSPETAAGLEPAARDGALLLLLMLLAGLIHAWQISHTAVAARDSIAFIRVAWQLQHYPAAAVMKQSLHPPLYPATVLAVSLPVRKLLPHVPEPVAMQYSAQLASALAGVLLVIPMFFLGRELFDRRVGFWAALLFQCLPVSSRAMSDGLTEGLFLLLIATGLLAALHAFRKGSAWWFGVCGLCTGLAYLTRPEGPLLGLATGLVLLALPLWDRLRWTWARTVACGLALSLTALVVGVPYMCVIGGVTKKTSPLNVLHVKVAGREPGATEPLANLDPLPRPPVRTKTYHSPLALILAEFHEGWREDFHPGSLAWGVKTLCKEAGKSFHYGLWLPALVGLWWFRRRLAGEPGAWVLLCMCLLHVLLLTALSVVAGYVSERHTLLFVLCGLFWAVAELLALPAQMSAVGRWLGTSPRVVDWWGCRPAVEVLVLLALTVSGLPEALKPLHAGRTGHKEAGFWLAAHADASDEVLDPFCWAHFYAGRVFAEGMPHPLPLGHDAKKYVVLDTSSHHSRIPQLPEAEAVARSGTPVFQWPSVREALVLVYEVNK